jgi:hypothetical protein
MNSRRRDTAVYFAYHTANSISQLFHHVFVPWQSMALCMVENKSCIWIANVVKGDVTVEVRIERANCSILLEKSCYYRRHNLLIWVVGTSIVSSL